MNFKIYSLKEMIGIFFEKILQSKTGRGLVLTCSAFVLMSFAESASGGIGEKLVQNVKENIAVKLIDSKVITVHKAVDINLISEEKAEEIVDAMTTAPGGVDANLSLWLKADNGASTANWLDHSGLGNNATGRSAAGGATGAMMNFNQTVSFAGATHDEAYDPPVTILGTGNTSHTFFSVGQGTGGTWLSGGTNNSTGNSFYIRNPSPNGTYDFMNLAHGVAGVTSAPRIMMGAYESSTATRDISINSGALSSVSTPATPFNFDGRNILIGHDNNTGGNIYSGTIGEIIVYDNQNVSAFQKQQIHAYLALKYGITIDQTVARDYIASDGTTRMWNALLNTTYSNDVFGIGRDDDSALDQRVSKSINSGAIFTVALDNDFTAANNDAARTTAFASDLQFLTFANDGGATTTQGSEVGGSYNVRVTREWQVQNTGSVGAVNVKFDGAWEGYDLLSDTDGDFSTTGDQTVLATLDANGEATGVTFTDGAYLTLAMIVVAPGGVASNLSLWLKADAGVTGGAAVTTWADQSGTANNATAVGGQEPDVTANTLNFNPTMTFAGSELLTGTSNLTRGNFIIVGDIDDTAGEFAFGATVDPLIRYFRANQGGGRALVGEGDNTYLYTDAATDPGPAILGVQYGTDQFQSNGVNQGFTIVDGALNPTVNTFDPFTNTYSIGGTNNTPSLNGTIAEIINYTSDVSAGDLQMINSYLALKYGITLDQTSATAYLASDGTTKAWDETANATYNKDIFGIGRDNASGLDQRVTKSINAGSIFTVALDNDFTIANTDAGRTTAFASDLQFLTFANDGGATTTQGSEVGGSYNVRVTREWQVQNTGSVGAVNVKFDGFADYDLLSDTDGDFSTTGDQTVLATLDANGEATGVTFTDGAYLTLAKIQAAPGGVATNNTLWLRADEGTSTTTDGADMTTWTDQSGNGNNATGIASPVYRNNTFNYNPGVEYPLGTAARHELTTRLSAQNTTMYVVGNPGSDFAELWSGDADHPFTNGSDVFLYLQGGNKVSFYEAPGVVTTPSLTWNPGEISLYRVELSNATNYNATYTKLAGASETLTSVNNSDYPGDGYAILGNWNTNDGALEPFGLVAETMVYNSSTQTAIEKQQIESYLALKYGITLSQTTAQNYILSDGTTVVWDATANAAYSQDIAGIGQDDMGTLLQKQSKSVNANGIVAIGLSDIAATNQANAATFAADKSFMVWGNNGGAATWTATGAPTNYEMLSRQWRVQETGTVGAVKMQFDVGDADFDVPVLNMGTAYYLIYDSNNNDDLSDESPITLTNSTGNIWETGTNVNLADGAEFTLATSTVAPDAPGGVAGLDLWFKADAGVMGTTSVTQWDDQSGLNRHVSSNNFTNPAVMNLTNPALVAGDFNYNPVLDFDSNLDALWSTNFSTMLNDDDIEVFMVMKEVAAGSRKVVAFNLPGITDAAAAFDHGIFYPNAMQSRDVFGGAPILSTTDGDMSGYMRNFYYGGATPGSNDASGAIRTNGLEVATTAGFPQLLGTERVAIGSAPGTALDEGFVGKLAEVVVYNSNLSGISRQQIDSYLALKYGLTIDQTVTTNYLLSDGTTAVWDATANAAYSNDIAGIGQDDTGTLLQKQSKSVNTDGIVAIGLNDIAATNQANAATFVADKSFMVWGNNGGAATWTTTGAPTNYEMLSRQWRVQETGTVGAVKMQFDVGDADFNVAELLNGTDYYLVYDADDDGDLSDETPIALTNSSGDLWETSTNVDFADGMEFTLATSTVVPDAPGGIAADLGLWFKADAGTNTTTEGAVVTSWTEQSSSGNNLTGIASPVYRNNTFNYNPGVEYTAAARHQLATEVAAPSTTMYVVGSPGGDNAELWSHEPAHPNQNVGDVLFYVSGGNKVGYYDGSGASPATPSLTWNTGEIALFRAEISNAPNYNVSYTKLGGNPEQLTSVNTQDLTEAYEFLGNWNLNNGVQEPFGLVAETMVYNSSTQTAIEKQQIESYLALKYGITLIQTTAQNYILSDGTTVVWDATANAAYSQDIAGIGQDDDSALLQKQSKSVNADGIVAIGLSDISATNQANAATFAADKSFMLWGNNGGAATWTATGAPTNYEMLSRQWRVQETGTVGAVKMQFDVADADFDVPVLNMGTAYYLIYDSNNNDDLSDESPITLTNSSGNIWETTANIDLADGMEFTLATSTVAPGGIAADLGLWFKADAGTNTTTEGAVVTSWTEQSSSGNNLTGIASPVYRNNTFNYNPGVEYPLGTAARHELTTRLSAQNTTMYVVGNPGSDFAELWSGDADHPFTNGSDVFLYLQSGNKVSFYEAPGVVTTPSLTWNPGEISLYRVELSNATNYNATYTKLAGASETLTSVNNSDYPGDGYAILGNWNTNDGALEPFGLVAETMVYNSSTQTAIEKQQIESYLALKYGITLSQTTAQNYILSDGTTVVWDATANAAYSQDIAGIGQDDVSVLLQKQSKSANPDGILAIGLDMIAASNQANTATFAANQSFMAWGNNDGAAAWTATGAPANYELLERQWKIQETGTVGSVAMRFDVGDAEFDVPNLLNGANYFLVYDSNNDGDLSDETPVALTNSSGDIWETSSNVDFADGAIFTLATEAVAAVIDTDGDGLTDDVDPDDDNDGIADTAETGDADGDGIPDSLESNTLDTDGDGTVDNADTDSDGDGTVDGTGGEQDGVETGPWNDTDSDGIPDHLDNSTGNGTDGSVAGSGDSDGDGISDATECPDGFQCPDSDLDGTPDYMDTYCNLNCDTNNDGDCDLNCDTDGDNIPDLNIDTDEDGDCDLNCDTDGDGDCDLNCDTDGDGDCDLNCDTDGDGDCDLNCDTDGDGDCDLNCDTDGDGDCDLNCDTDGDGDCDLNCDTDGDGDCDLNCDTDGDGDCDLNCDTDGDGDCDLNCDTDGDGDCDLNCDTDGDGDCDLNCDTDGDGDCDLNCDTDGDGDCDLNCDTDGDGDCDLNCDTDGDGDCDLNCDTDGDGDCDLNCDTDGDGDCDLNCDTDGDGDCDLNCDTDGDGDCDLNCDTDGDGDCDLNCDTDGDGDCDLNCDTDGDGDCDLNCDTDGDGDCDLNCDTDGDGDCDLNCDTDGDGDCDLNCDTDGDGDCDLNCDTDGDGDCDLNCDTDGDGDCDLNCDTDGDGDCDLNCDTDGDGDCDLNCDTDGDGDCDLNCDTDGDGDCDLNCDTDGDGDCDLNCDTDGDGDCDLNCDTDGDGDCDLNCDTDGDGDCDLNCDTDGDGDCDLNCDTDGDGDCDLNCDTDGDGDCDLNCDTDGDGDCDLNCDTDGDGDCDLNCDTDGDGDCDLNCDTDGDGDCDLNCDTDGDGDCDLNCDTDGDGDCDLNCDTDGDGDCDLNCDTDGDGDCDLNCDTDGDGDCDLNCDTDGDGDCDLNCDTDGDGDCDLNCDTDGDGDCDLNCDTDGDGDCDLNCDTDGDGDCDLNCDTDGDGDCDLNCDTDGDGDCDLNCDTDGDGDCDLNCDTDGDGDCDLNCDTDGDGDCDLNCDTDGDGDCDLNCDTDGDGDCDINCDDAIKLNIKAFLGAAYDDNASLMSDSLRVKGLLPFAQPYTNHPDIKYTGIETVVDTTVFDVTGDDAIVDWVIIELRDPIDPTIAVATRAGLIQRDGDVVDIDGVSSLNINSPDGPYYVALRHRNHLGIMSADTTTLTNQTVDFDFTSSASEIYKLSGATGSDHNRMELQDGNFALWPGNYGSLNGTGNRIIFKGPNSDADEVFFRVLTDPANTDFDPIFMAEDVYDRSDGNLDGRIIFQGAGADQDFIFISTGLHPDNSSGSSIFVIYEQIPR